ncbi:hypothetical protein M4Z58_23145, partial [Escherichia coli]|nr:hypothetical protein [Escherichia coli]
TRTDLHRCYSPISFTVIRTGCTKEYTVANRHNYPASSKRYQLTDIDGEDAFIRIGSIAMVRVPLDAMEPVEEDDE